uniref:C-type lectin lectoxin-Thr1-like n=1 Tax=Styela clava TaxID=7725 RepID=UPI001939439D|nr:C-type lectin lectoxin-Thr1-like [Styela clava]
MHLYCTNRDQHSVRTGYRIKQGKAGPAGPPGVVNYKIVNETIKEHFNDISGQIQAKMTQIGPIVEKSSEDIEDLKAVMQQIREQLGRLRTLNIHQIVDISTWYKARNNYYYKLFDDQATYAEAKANCTILGGQLASAGIRDEDIRREILPLVKSGEFQTWIGLNDIQEENTFIWEDGVTATAGSIPWHDGQPNSLGGNQDCVEMQPSFGWELNDQNCTIKRKYLCEIEP